MRSDANYSRSLTKALFLALGSVIAALMMMDSSAIAATHKKPVSVISGTVSGEGVVSVTVLRTGKSTHTNKTGFFILKGRMLSGRHTLVFRKRHEKFTTTVDVPAGSKLILSDISLSGDSASSSEEDLSVHGTLTAVDCVASPNTLTVAPSKGGTAVLMAFDTATTIIIDDATGSAITSCSTLASNYIGDPADAEGVLNSSGGITATHVELNPSPSGGGGGEDASFKGRVQSESCPNSIVVQRSDGTNVTVNIGPSTKIDIEGPGGSSSGQCSDIPMSAVVEVEGVPQADGSINATKIGVQEQEFEAHGTIDSINCGATPPSFSFVPDGASAVTVTIQPATSIEVGDKSDAACTDLVGAAAHVQGISQSDGSVAATEIQQ
jgi:hypothetical protein